MSITLETLRPEDYFKHLEKLREAVTIPFTFTEKDFIRKPMTAYISSAAISPHKNIKSIKHKGNATIMEFINKTTKAVLQEGDTYDKEKAYMICALKFILGEKGFYDMMKDFEKVEKRQEELEKIAREEAEFAKRRKEKALRKKAKRKEKKRQEAIEIQKEAYLQAMEEHQAKTLGWKDK